MDKKELFAEIEEEIKNLQRLEKEMKTLLLKKKREWTFMEIRASASILHDFYSGVEKIFEKIALVVDNHLPTGESWHIELLTQMAKPAGNLRPPVLSQELYEKMKEYLRFRHLFRHIYGFELKWERIEPLILNFSQVIGKLKAEIKNLEIFSISDIFPFLLPIYFSLFLISSDRPRQLNELIGHKVSFNYIFVDLIMRLISTAGTGGDIYLIENLPVFWRTPETLYTLSGGQILTQF